MLTPTVAGARPASVYLIHVLVLGIHIYPKPGASSPGFSRVIFTVISDLGELLCMVMGRSQ